MRVRLSEGSELKVAVNGQGLRLGEQVTLGCRAEHVTLAAEQSAAENTLSLTINFVEHLGDASIVYANLVDETSVLAIKLATDTVNVKAGNQIKVQLSASRCHLFDASGKACARI